MKRIKQIMGWCSGLCIGLLACTDDRTENPDVTGNVAIELSGLATDAAVATRAPGQAESNLYLKAVVDTTGTTYIEETRITCPQGLTDTAPRDMQFESGTHYYPLNRYALRFFAYSGTANGDYMSLTAGNTAEQDALLSNFGERADGTFSQEGEGTLGSSDNPAAVLNFRHVMTQLNVEVEIDDEEEPGTVTQVPKTVRFRMADIPSTGKYSIYSEAPDPADDSAADRATDTNGTYTVQLGTNYLIPNGADLTGKQLTYLEVDDFIATAPDLAGYKVELSPGNTVSTSMALLPGYAYTLTFLIRRLKVEGITLRKIDWIAKDIDQEGVTYVPKYLDLDLGDYTNAGADTITKAVLFTTGMLQYVGRPEDGGGDYARMQYVTMPDAYDVDSIQLYTRNGLLIATSVQTSVYDGNTLTLPLSAAGMLPVDNSQPYNATTNPYAVTNAHQFINIAKAPGDSYRQVINIDMDALVTEEDKMVSALSEFTGHYDGQDYWVSNVRIAGPGLIRTNKGILENMRLESGEIDASGETVAVGSLCGTNEGTLLACINEARIVNATGTVGGVCGVNASAGLIVACVNMGEIPQGSTVGGICGDNRNTAANALVSCFSTGMLNRSATHLGGICGTVSASSNTVLNTCFWLVGTAGRGIGTAEVAVGNNTVGMTDVSDVSPERLRNEVSATEDPLTDGIVALLNHALSLSPVTEATDYKFVLDQILTASVWPLPLKQ
ncbi:MAG: fimbrillin family protein [Bacteroides sp.]|nr:fimbrillin family protein [Bacteroides sp.]